MPRNSIIGFLLGLVGLSKIVGFTTPWLMLIYPALVVIIVMSLFADFSKVKFAAQAGVIVAILFSIGDFQAKFYRRSVSSSCWRYGWRF